jgi:hypothetical protein
MLAQDAASTMAEARNIYTGVNSYILKIIVNKNN